MSRRALRRRVSWLRATGCFPKTLLDCSVRLRNSLKLSQNFRAVNCELKKNEGIPYPKETTLPGVYPRHRHTHFDDNDAMSARYADPAASVPQAASLLASCRGLHLHPFRSDARFPAPQFPTTTKTQRAGAIGSMDRGQWMAASRAATASLDGPATFPSGSSGDADDGEVLRSP